VGRTCPLACWFALLLATLPGVFPRALHWNRTWLAMFLANGYENTMPTVQRPPRTR